MKAVIFFLAFLPLRVYGQIQLDSVIANFERSFDTTLSPCFKTRLDSVYKFLGSPKIFVTEKGARFFPGKIFITNPSFLDEVVEELCHVYQWEKKGGKFRLTVAFAWQTGKATLMSLFKKRRACPTCPRVKYSAYERYRDGAYGPPKRDQKYFWAYEYEAHEVIAPGLWDYLTCGSGGVPIAPVRK